MPLNIRTIGWSGYGYYEEMGYIRSQNFTRYVILSTRLSSIRVIVRMKQWLEHSFSRSEKHVRDKKQWIAHIMYLFSTFSHICHPERIYLGKTEKRHEHIKNSF